jgi:hypothetical protein
VCFPADAHVENSCCSFKEGPLSTFLKHCSQVHLADISTFARFCAQRLPKALELDSVNGFPRVVRGNSTIIIRVILKAAARSTYTEIPHAATQGKKDCQSFWPLPEVPYRLSKEST